MTVRPYIGYLDGLRGLAALYVVFFHVFAGYRSDLPSWLAPLSWFFSHGHVSVDIFIVISGFCLALPLAGPSAGWPSHQIPHFLQRRAKRILPPYYFAFLLTLLGLIASSEGLAYLRGERNPTWLENFDPQNLLSHLFLVHNWSERWSQAINPPFWSMGTEWQIYFVFAFALAPLIVRRLWLSSYLIGAVLVLAAYWICGSLQALISACPWYVILFTFGAQAAVHLNSATPRSSACWLALGVACCVVSGFFSGAAAFMVLDIGAGAIAVSGLLFLSIRRSTPFPPGQLLLCLLESRALFTLGAISYSLYLIHAPVLAKLRIWITAAHLEPLSAFAATIIINIPLTIGVAYIFHLFCEKPFMKSAPAAPAPAAPAAPLAPAS